MKRVQNNSSVLSVKTKTFFFLLFLFFVPVTAFVLNNEAKISNAIVISPEGSQKKIDIPFNSNKDGELNVFTYKMTLTNSILFSGTLQVIPDDCMEEMSINGELLPQYLFEKGGCDGLNGFYIDTSPYLKKGKNEVWFKIKNTHGFYGLIIRDTTFYEKYVLICLVVFLFVLLKHKQLYYSLLYAVKLMFDRYKIIIWLITGQIAVVFLTLIGSAWGNNEVFFWVIIFELIAFVSVIAVFCVYQSVRYGKIVALLFAILILLCLVYFVNLDHSLFSYDYDGHLKYIQYIIENGEVPVSSGGWSFYHPSFYYRCAAIFWGITASSGQLNNAEFFKTVQAFSVVLFIIYCYFSLKSIDLIFRKINDLWVSKNEKTSKIIYLLVAGLFLFWPSNPIVSVRVGNDMMFDMLFAMSFYYALKYWQTDSFSYLSFALILAALDVWSKTNGFISFGIIGILIVYKCIVDLRKNRLITKYGYQFFLFGSFVVISFYFSFHEKIEQLKRDPEVRLVVGNTAGLGEQLNVENKAVNYLSLDPIKFIQIPFTSSSDSAKGKNSFWFYLFKTSMFGEFSFDTTSLALLSKILSSCFLILLIYAVIGLFNGISNPELYFPVHIEITTLIVSMILFRAYYPYSSSNDFRYIYPAILPFVLFIGSGLVFLSRFKALFYSAIGVLIAFVISCVCFQLLTIIHY